MHYHTQRISYSTGAGPELRLLTGIDTVGPSGLMMGVEVGAELGGGEALEGPLHLLGKVVGLPPGYRSNSRL